MSIGIAVVKHVSTLPAVAILGFVMSKFWTAAESDLELLEVVGGEIGIPHDRGCDFGVKGLAGVHWYRHSDTRGVTEYAVAFPLTHVAEAVRLKNSQGLRPSDARGPRGHTATFRVRRLTLSLFGTSSPQSRRSSM